MTTNDLDQAREWAKDVHPGHHPEAVATAKVINSLPDEWIDADNLRGVIGRWDALLADDDHEDMHGMLDDLRALFPAPQPRTLADMTREEREACQWMQADFDHSFADPPIRVVITMIHQNVANIILPSGSINCVMHESLTPLPDLRRMVWPKEQATEGTFDLPEPEDVPAGELWLVEFDGQQHAAERGLSGAEKPWWLMFGWRVSDSEITLVSRLVPEDTHE